jgi:hypothetical protein
MPVDAEDAGEVYEVTVNHDDSPDGVAEKFLEVFRAMGIAVRDASEDDVPSVTYAIGGKATPEGER